MNENRWRAAARGGLATVLPTLLLAGLLAASSASSGGTPSLDREPTLDMTVTTK
jgi:hypothetical protein